VPSAQVKSCICSPVCPHGAPRSASPSSAATTPSGLLLRPAGVRCTATAARHVARRDGPADRAHPGPGDPSSAAFLVAAGVLVPRSGCCTRRGRELERTGFLRIVRRMRGIVFGDLERNPAS